MTSMIQRMLNREEGQGMVEYGLIIALIALAVIVTLGLLGGQLNTLFVSIKDTLTP